ncbi:hypothetical protein C0989_009608 [Termitomyces sp. Mn162]|nr:hypothetical protein C0989_009608 [Termitomyces sp. Mn162]
MSGPDTRSGEDTNRGECRSLVFLGREHEDRKNKGTRNEHLDEDPLGKTKKKKERRSDELQYRRLTICFEVDE